MLPSSALLFVGNWRTGPAPQIQLPGLAGDTNAVNVVSPMPVVAPSPGPSDGFQITGRIVRVITFQSSFTEIGITGWMLRMFCVPLSGPKLRLVLFWNGTLIEIADRILRELRELRCAHLGGRGWACRHQRRAPRSSGHPARSGPNRHCSLHALREGIESNAVEESASTAAPARSAAHAPAWPCRRRSSRPARRSASRALRWDCRSNYRRSCQLFIAQTSPAGPTAMSVCICRPPPT